MPARPCFATPRAAFASLALSLAFLPFALCPPTPLFSSPAQAGLPFGLTGAVLRARRRHMWQEREREREDAEAEAAAAAAGTCGEGEGSGSAAAAPAPALSLSLSDFLAFAPPPAAAELLAEAGAGALAGSGAGLGLVPPPPPTPSAALASPRPPPPLRSADADSDVFGGAGGNAAAPGEAPFDAFRGSGDVFAITGDDDEGAADGAGSARERGSGAGGVQRGAAHASAPLRADAARRAAAVSRRDLTVVLLAAAAAEPEMRYTQVRSDREQACARGELRRRATAVPCARRRRRSQARTDLSRHSQGLNCAARLLLEIARGRGGDDEADAEAEANAVDGDPDANEADEADGGAAFGADLRSGARISRAALDAANMLRALLAAPRAPPLEARDAAGSDAGAAARAREQRPRLNFRALFSPQARMGELRL